MFRSPFRAGLLAALASGLMFFFAFDTGPLPYLLLIAPAPVLLYAMRVQHLLPALLAAFLANALGRLGLVFTYLDIMPAVILIAWATLWPLHFTLIVAITRGAARRLPAWIALLSYPLAMTASEQLIFSVSPHGSFGAVGYALTYLAPVNQVASLGGVAALTFLVSLVPMAAVMLAWAPRQRRLLMCLAGAPLLLAALFGSWQLARPHDETRRVALLAIDAVQDDEIETAAEGAAASQAYLDALAGLADTGDAVGDGASTRPDIIVLPEKSLVQRPGWADPAVALRAFAERSGIAVVAGFADWRDGGRGANSAELYRPGAPTLRYVKRHLIPGLEDGFAGGADAALDGPLGIAICKDMDFARTIRDYGRAGISLLLVPAWDFRADAELHARMSVLRGIENGIAVARVAANGLLTVTDAQGRFAAHAASDAQRPVSVLASVGIAPGATPYARLGDLFGWFCVGATALLLAALLACRFRYGALKQQVPGRG